MKTAPDLHPIRLIFLLSRNWRSLPLRAHSHSAILTKLLSASEVLVVKGPMLFVCTFILSGGALCMPTNCSAVSHKCTCRRLSALLYIRFSVAVIKLCDC